MVMSLNACSKGRAKSRPVLIVTCGSLHISYLRRRCLMHSTFLGQDSVLETDLPVTEAYHSFPEWHVRPEEDIRLFASKPPDSRLGHSREN